MYIHTYTREAISKAEARKRIETKRKKEERKTRRKKLKKKEKETKERKKKRNERNEGKTQPAACVYDE